MRYGIGNIEKSVSEKGIRDFYLEDEENHIEIRYYDQIIPEFDATVIGVKAIDKTDGDKTTTKTVTIKVKVTERLSDADIMSKIHQVHEELKYM